jgi:hypothetical protein
LATSRNQSNWIQLINLKSIRRRRWDDGGGDDARAVDAVDADVARWIGERDPVRWIAEWTRGGARGGAAGRFARADADVVYANADVGIRVRWERLRDMSEPVGSDEAGGDGESG